MNTLTRGEKIDRFMEDAKAVVIKGLLIVWAVLTMFLAIGFAGNYVEVKNLKQEVKRMEEEKKAEATTYVVVDGHKYEVIDMAY